MTTCPSCGQELPTTCPECNLPRPEQWMACTKMVPGLVTQHAHLCFECGSKCLLVDPNDDTAQLAERIRTAMTTPTTEQTGTMSSLDLRTGVDLDWIADSRIALAALLVDPEKRVQALDGTARSGEGHVDTVVRLSCEIADAMRAQRGARGGVRNGNDPREMMALVQENMPLILKFFEQLHEMGPKHEKRRGE